MNVENMNIKIGFIGLGILTTITTSGDLSYVTISDKYKIIIEDKTKELRNTGAKAVVLVAYSGYTCENEKKDNLNTQELGIFDKDTAKKCKP